MGQSPTDVDLEVGHLKERIRLLEAMLRHSRDLLFSLDEEGRILSVNEAVERVLGYTEQELAGTAFDDLIAPESLKTTTQLRASIRNRVGESVNIDLHRERRIVIGRDLA